MPPLTSPLSRGREERGLSATGIKRFVGWIISRQTLSTEQKLAKFMDLNKLFHPRSVALIGVSNEQNKLSGRPFRFFREYGYSGNVYPVNPKYQEISGVPCFAKLSEIPGEVDLAVITLPASAVPRALEECGLKGVKAAAIVSSGFAEVGGEGARLQDELQRIATAKEIAVCGPNCSGFVYFPEKVTATFSVGLDAGFPETGPAAFISQSGALSSYILGAAKERGLACRYWITTGNETRGRALFPRREYKNSRRRSG